MKFVLRPKKPLALKPSTKVTYKTFAANADQKKVSADDAFLTANRQRQALKASFAKRETREYGDPTPSAGPSNTYKPERAQEWAKSGFYVTSRNTAKGVEYNREAVLATSQKRSLLASMFSKPQPSLVRYRKGNGQINRSKYDSPAYLRAQRKLVSKKIVEEGGKYVTMSEDGSRKFGTYDTLNGAKRRLHQVEYFKAKSAAKKKQDKKLHPAAVGAATAGGALAGQSAYMFPGSAFKNYYVRRKFDASRPNWDKSQKKAWASHINKPKEGFKPDPKDPRTPTEQWRTSKDFFRKFPKELPTGGTRRVMGYAFKGKTGHAVAGTMMAAGATASYKVATKDKVKKGLPSIARGAGYRKVSDPDAFLYLRGRMARHDEGRRAAESISEFRNGPKMGRSTQRFAGGLKRKRRLRAIPKPAETGPLRGGDGAEALPPRKREHTRVVDTYMDGTTSVIDRVAGKPTYYIRSKIGKGYVPKGQWSLKLLKDPGLMVPVAGVTTAGIAGTGLALRGKKRKK